MKRFVFILLAIAAAVLLLPLFSPAQSGQQSVAYSIETTSRPDSFFLVETITQNTDAGPRASVQVNYILVRDTAQLTNLRTRLLQEAAEAEARAADQATKAAVARAQAAAILEASNQAFRPATKATDQPKKEPPELKKKRPKKPKKV